MFSFERVSAAFVSLPVQRPRRLKTNTMKSAITMSKRIPGPFVTAQSLTFTAMFFAIFASAPTERSPAVSFVVDATSAVSASALSPSPTALSAPVSPRAWSATVSSEAFFFSIAASSGLAAPLSLSRSASSVLIRSVYASALVLASYETLYEYAWLARPMRLVPALAGDFPRSTDDGRTLTIRLRDVDAADRRVDGVLVAADDTTATIRRSDGDERVVRFDAIDKARTVFEWGPAPKPGGKNAAQNKNAAQKKQQKQQKSAAATARADRDPTKEKQTS